MAEITFESLSLAPEAAKGTPEAAPVTFANLFGTLDPTREYYEPVESSGNLAQRQRVKAVREYGVWSGDGPLDPNTFVEFCNLVAKGGVTPTQPGLAASTYDWDFTPTMTSDDLEMATFWWGDPNMTNVFRGSYGFIDQMTVSSDASGTEGATLSLSGMTQYPAKVAAPTYPSQAFAPLIAGLNMEVFVDTSSPIGTTAVTGRVVSAQHVLAGEIKPKYVAAGPGAAKTYSRHGRGRRGLVTTVVMEIPDYTEIDLMLAEDTIVKLRVVHNGAFIENDGSDDFYYGVTFDTYGPLRFAGWGELEGTNRTVTFEVHSQYDTTLGADWRIFVRNTKAALAT